MKMKYLTLSLFSFLSGISANVLASGYEIPLESVSQLGAAFSGEAASALDASTAYYNPAGLIYIPEKQLIISAINASAVSEFTGTARSPSATLNPAFNFSDTGSATLSAGGVIPAIHYAMPIYKNKMVAGFSVTAPYGLGGGFPHNSIVRYSLQDALLGFLNLSPNIGYKVNDKLSVGFGLDFVYGTQTSLSAVRFIPNTDGKIETEAAGWGYGWHSGLMYQITPTTRLGLAYRSQVTTDMSGSSKFTLPSFSGGQPTVYENQQLITSSTLPPTSTLGLFHNLSARWDIMGTIKYTQWARLADSMVNNIITPAGLISSKAPLQYKNTFDYNLGTSYKLNKAWQLKAGVGYAQTPTNDVTRSIGLMDVGHYIVAVGTHYQATPITGIDIAYGSYLGKSVPVNHVATNIEKGFGKNAVHLIGVQLTWNLG